MVLGRAGQRRRGQGDCEGDSGSRGAGACFAPRRVRRSGDRLPVGLSGRNRIRRSGDLGVVTAVSCGFRVQVPPPGGALWQT